MCFGEMESLTELVLCTLNMKPNQKKKQPFQRLREARFSLDDPKACVCLKYHREANPLLKRKSACQMVDPNPLD